MKQQELFMTSILVVELYRLDHQLHQLMKLDADHWLEL